VLPKGRHIRGWQKKDEIKIHMLWLAPFGGGCRPGENSGSMAKKGGKRSVWAI